MYKEKPLEVVSHDLWISMNSLQALANHFTEEEQQSVQASASKQAETQRQQNWVKWPAFGSSGK